MYLRLFRPALMPDPGDPPVGLFSLYPYRLIQLKNHKKVIGSNYNFCFPKPYDLDNDTYNIALLLMLFEI